jgi:alpha-L-rhamnosidase
MQWLMQTLTRIGRADVALQIARQPTQPGWGYMIDRDATTVWERWDSDTQGAGMNSEALLILAGNLGSWFYQAVAGIELDPSVPGWRRALMRPQLVGPIDRASAKLDTVSGRYETDWHWRDALLEWTATVPPNSTATAWIPTDDPAGVTEGGRSIANASGVRVLREEPRALVVELGSGTYRIGARWSGASQ